MKRGNLSEGTLIYTSFLQNGHLRITSVSLGLVVLSRDMT